MSYKIGDRVKVVSRTIKSAHGKPVDIECFGELGTVVDYGSPATKFDYKVQLDRSIYVAVPSKMTWWFNFGDLSPDGGHHKMTEPDMTLDEIELANEIYERVSGST